MLALRPQTRIEILLVGCFGTTNCFPFSIQLFANYNFTSSLALAMTCFANYAKHVIASFIKPEFDPIIKQRGRNFPRIELRNEVTGARKIYSDWETIWKL